MSTVSAVLWSSKKTSTASTQRCLCKGGATLAKKQSRFRMRMRFGPESNANIFIPSSLFYRRRIDALFPPVSPVKDAIDRTRQSVSVCVCWGVSFPPKFGTRRHTVLNGTVLVSQFVSMSAYTHVLRWKTNFPASPARCETTLMKTVLGERVFLCAGGESVENSL